MQKIRVGLLIDDYNVPIWKIKMLERIISSDYAELVLVVKKDCQPLPRRSIKTRIKDKTRYIIYEYYKKWEDRKFVGLPHAFEQSDLRQIIHPFPILNVKCVEKKFSDFVVESDIEQIRKYDVDVFIRLGFRILRGDILKVAKMGVWSYHHGDNRVNRGGPAGFWEYFRKEREVGSVLQILTEDLDGGAVMFRSWSTVSYTLNETLNGYYWKTALFIPRKLKELHKLGPEEFTKKLKAENADLGFYSSKLYTLPGNGSFFKLITSTLLGKLQHKFWDKFYFEQWGLFYSFTKKNEPSTSIFRYKRLSPPKDRFWADPCVIYENGKYYIFIEELIYKTNKGHIALIEMDEKGLPSQPKIILEKPYHLSYPFVFKYQGDYYMVPETEQNMSIELYKATNFPYEWKFEMTLMENITAVDTTVFVKDEKVWLFTNIVEMEGAPFHDELFLFSSDTLLTKNWVSHPCNPVVSDVKSARSAGKIFYHNGKLYRPSQDCSTRYGYATVINEIQALNEDEYKESKVTKISPDWADDVLATHTFSSDKHLSVIDALVKRKK